MAEEASKNPGKRSTITVKEEPTENETDRAGSKTDCKKRKLQSEGYGEEEKGKASTQSQTTAKEGEKYTRKASTKIVKEELSQENLDIDFVGPSKKIKTKSSGKKRGKSEEYGEEGNSHVNVAPDLSTFERVATETQTPVLQSKHSSVGKSIVKQKIKSERKETEIDGKVEKERKNKTKAKISSVKIKEEPGEETWPPNEKRTKSGVMKGKFCKEEKEEKGRVYTLAITDAVKDPLHEKANVYCEGNDIWDCKLYQTNIGKHNNKYFLIQLLKENGQNTYHVWWRWGRVGYKGPEEHKSYGENLNEAKKQFRKKFKDKTKNNWHEREDFKTCRGKYDLMAIDYEIEGTDGDGRELLKAERKCSDQIVPYEGKYMYKLRSEHIEAGISALKIIEDCIEDCKEEPKLAEACGEFYTKIPHNFGMKSPELIKDIETIKLKRQLLEDLRGRTFDSLAFPEQPQQSANSCE